MANLPTGTVTFLFTDIEGSTRFWELYPDAMREALVRHDALLTEGIERQGGAVVKNRGEGDSFFAVFNLASDAVAAACNVQQQLFAEPWPAGISLRVRMGIHTGEAELRGADYFGSAVNRCARLRSIAHGGQVLLSGVTAEVVAESLPPGTRLRPLGTHRLRDLVRPEQVYQLVHPALASTFPPLRSLDALPNNLPTQLTSFIGREAEMAEVKQLLTTTRLLSLTGAGGAGKTRLSVQVGADLLEQFVDGVWLVELAALRDPALVTQAVASALSVREEPGRPLLTTLVDHLRHKQILLILDNCEHVVEPSAELADRLLRNCLGVRILVTTRQALGVPGETTWRMPSLALPRLNELPPIDRLTEYEALRLFVERAKTARPGFTVTRENAPAILEICYRLDAAPLALELAAARVKVLSVEQIAGRLGDRFGLLTGGSRTLLPRQQTLRALVDWSYDLLDEDERALWRRLSVFVSGFGLPAAEAVCADDDIQSYAVLDLLTQLLDKSLVVAEEVGHEGRYRLLETIRHYGLERLDGAGETAATHRRHARHFMTLAEDAETELRGPRQVAWLDRLEREHDNLRAAMRWALENEATDIAMRLAAALWRFWWVRGHLSEGQRWLDAALAKSGIAPLPLRAKLLDGAGTLAWVRGDYDRAATLYQESLTLFTQLGDKRGIALSLSGLGNVASVRGDYANARTQYEESLALRRSLGHTWGIATSLNNLGILAHGQGDYARAAELAAESLDLFRDLGHTLGVAQALANLGMVAREQGNYPRAAALANESLGLLRQQAAKADVPQCLEILAAVAVAQDEPERAARLFGAAEALREATGAVLSPPERAVTTRFVSMTREHFTAEEFAAAWAAGRGLAFDQAIAFALEHQSGQH